MSFSWSSPESSGRPESAAGVAVRAMSVNPSAPLAARPLRPVRRNHPVTAPFRSIHPATGVLLQDYPADDERTARARLARVEAVQRDWRTVPLDQRCARIRALAAHLRAERERLARLITLEMGKPLVEARREIEKCAAACLHFADTAALHLQAESPTGAPRGAAVFRMPRGVLLAIMPWNFPCWQPLRSGLPALLAGNGVLHKPAPNVAGCALALEALLARAGLPPGLWRVTLAEHDAVARLIADPAVALVAFTGSTAAGRRIAARAGAALKPVALELGGSDAYLVLADADLDHAAARLAEARLVNAGQTCISPKRLIVDRRVAADFEARLAAHFAAAQAGDPLDPATTLGPLARPDLRQQVHRAVRASVQAGARLVMGGRIPEAPGWAYPPTVLAAVQPEHAAARQEVFGPVAVILPADGEEAAVALANATPYGLGAGVFTRDVERGARLAAERLEAGMTCVNGCVRSDLALPFGGTRASGYGRELGAEGWRTVTQTKTVLRG